MGTILAFYFGRENFEAANKAVAEATRMRAGEIEKKPAKEFMISATGIHALRETPEKTLSDMTIGDIRARFAEKPEFKRLPILGPDGSAKMVIHEGSFGPLVLEALRTTTEDEEETSLTALDNKKFLESIENKPKIRDLFEKSFVTVPEDATLGEAKRAMEQTSGCQDVFLTKTGKRAEPVVGWLTNVIILEQAEA